MMFSSFVQMGVLQDILPFNLCLYFLVSTTLFTLLLFFLFDLSLYYSFPLSSPFLCMFFPVCPSFRKAERRTSTLKREKEDWMLQEEQTRHYLGAVMSVAEHISKERDQLLHVVLLMLLLLHKDCVLHIVNQHAAQGHVCETKNSYQASC